MVGRVMAILSAFRPTDGDLSLAELARRCGLPKPTVHRLVRQLGTYGAVEISPRGVRLGMNLFEIGQLAARPRTLREAATPHLADLQEATGETVHLAVADGEDVVYVQKLESRRAPAVGSRVGGRMPAYCTAVGKVLLAHAPAEQIEALLSRPLRRRTPRTTVAPGLLTRELQRIRDTGIAEEHEESTVGIACVASPVLDDGGAAVAAVSITARVGVRTDRLAPAVRTAALGISRSLRHTVVAVPARDGAGATR
ncbi:IclR family transcriptional regulator [Pseudonocardia autotrophica]|nr:IclR family transcriptional regulator [Pseudonocardia autotrophica]